MWKQVMLNTMCVYVGALLAIGTVIVARVAYEVARAEATETAQAR